MTESRFRGQYPGQSIFLHCVAPYTALCHPYSALQEGCEARRDGCRGGWSAGGGVRSRQRPKSESDPVAAHRLPTGADHQMTTSTFLRLALIASDEASRDLCPWRLQSSPDILHIPTASRSHWLGMTGGLDSCWRIPGRPGREKGGHKHPKWSRFVTGGDTSSLPGHRALRPGVRVLGTRRVSRGWRAFGHPPLRIGLGRANCPAIRFNDQRRGAATPRLWYR